MPARGTFFVTTFCGQTAGGSVFKSSEIEFDTAKDAANIAKHGVSLARAGELDICFVEEDRRHTYGEARYRAFGLLDGFPHSLAFTMRGSVLRAISLRRAHKEEFDAYVSHP